MTVWQGMLIVPNFEDGVNMIAETAEEIENCFKTVIKIHNATYTRNILDKGIIEYVVRWPGEFGNGMYDEFLIEPYPLGVNKWYIDREEGTEDDSGTTD